MMILSMLSAFTGSAELWEPILTASLRQTRSTMLLKDSAGKPLPLGLVDGHGAQILNQTIGSVIAMALGLIGSFIILKIVDILVGVRADSKEETMGLDLSMHGEEGYNFEA